MADAPPAPSAYEIPYLRLFPWLRIFRAAGEATDPKKLMLAALGLILTWSGWIALDAAGATGNWGWQVWADGPWERVPPGEFAAVAPNRAIEPFWLIVYPFFGVVRSPQIAVRLVNVIAGLWAVVVWALIGSAVARIAIVERVSGERLGLLEALRFALSKWRSLVGAPLTPMLGVVIVTVPIALFGILYRMGSTVGPTIAGLLAVLPLLGGLLLALIVFAPLLGWPMMVASIAAEDDDAFDAVSRTYAYVYQRPWHYAAYIALAIAVGTGGLLFVSVFVRLAVQMTEWGLSLGAGEQEAARAFFNADQGTSAASALLHSFWLSAVALFLRGWVYSYFWTAAGSLYLLLRRDVDRTPISTVALRNRSSSDTATDSPARDVEAPSTSAIPGSACGGRAGGR